MKMYLIAYSFRVQFSFSLCLPEFMVCKSTIVQNRQPQNKNANRKNCTPQLVWYVSSVSVEHTAQSQHGRTYSYFTCTWLLLSFSCTQISCTVYACVCVCVNIFTDIEHETYVCTFWLQHPCNKISVWVVEFARELKNDRNKKKTHTLKSKLIIIHQMVAWNDKIYRQQSSQGDCHRKRNQNKTTKSNGIK